MEGGCVRVSSGELTRFSFGPGDGTDSSYYRSVVWERELGVLEEALHRLSAEYDAFLYGTASKPPSESRKHVDQMLRRLSSANFEVAAERYRFNTLQGRYATMIERWERLQNEKESGRRPGMYGHFAAASPPRETPSGGRHFVGSPNAGASRSVEAREEAASADRRLFEKYVAARKARGENVEGYVFQKFAESLAKERARLAERLGSEDVVFDVAEREGRVKLVARRADASRAAGASGDEK
jgi:hypothetical protein